MAKSFLLGRLAVAYWNENNQKIGDVGAGPDPDDYSMQWLADIGTKVLGNITDLRLPLTPEFADGTTRASAASGFSSQITVLNSSEVTFGMRYIPTDPAAAVPPPWNTFTDLLLTQWQAGDTIAVALLDQDIATAKHQGLTANFSIGVEFSQEIRDIQKVQVTLTGTDNINYYQS